MINLEEQLKIIEAAKTKISYKTEELNKKLNQFKAQAEATNDSYALDLIEKIQNSSTEEELLELESQIRKDLEESVNKIVEFVGKNPELSKELGLNEGNLVQFLN